MSDRVISASQLVPGNVLLSKGCDYLADLISLLDGSRYSHAALWAGDGVVEAVRNGVTHEPLLQSLLEHPRQYVDVFRWIPRRVSNPAAEPIIAAALQHTGKSYAMGELRLIAALTLATHSGWTREMRELFRLRLADLTVLLRGANQEAPRRSMICSELVARAFFEGEPKQRSYALQLNITGARMVRGQLGLAGAGPMSIKSAEPELEALLVEARKLLVPNASMQPPISRVDATRDTRVIAGCGFPLHLVTPRDLFTSPDLEFVARLNLESLSEALRS